MSIPTTRVCANHSTPFEAFCDAYFANHSVVIWKGSRAFAGKSFLLALLGYMEEICLGAEVVILGGSGAQSARVHEYQQLFWGYESAPLYLLRGNPTGERTRLVNGGGIICLKASQTSVRGPHPQRLRLDEVDEMPLEIFDAAMGQTLATPNVNANTVCSSTEQYADGTMHEARLRAARNGWKIHEWCYRETMQPHGWLLPSEIVRKRAEVPESMWNAEYELQEPSIEGRAIVTEAVDATFDPTLDWAEKGVQAGGKYSMGIDWAQERDQTVISIFDVSKSPMELVYYDHMNRLPWPVMISRANEVAKLYRATVHHDATGLGGVVADYMEGTVPGLRRQINDVILAGRKRSDLLTEYIAGIEKGEIIAPRLEHPYLEHKYATIDDIYGSGHLPDSICSMALAYYGRHKARKDTMQAPLSMTGQSRWSQA